jgi:protein-disulfide isomerase
MRAPALALVLALALTGVAQAQNQAGAAAPAPATAAVPPPASWKGDEYVIGSPKAKVTLVEYASVACPHCARFDATVFPELKSKYIDTGKVRFVYREMLVGNEGMVEMAAVGFLLARCAGHDQYFDVVQQTYRAQPEIFNGGDMKAVFTRIAKAHGLSEAQLQACVEDKASLAALNARVQRAEQVDKIDSTPSLVADGKVLKQSPGKEWDFAMLDSQLKPLLGGGKRAKS